MKITKCLYCSGKKLEPVTHRSDDVGILKCATCGMMMVERTNDDVEQLYSAEYFEKKADTKTGYTNYLSLPVANVIGKYGLVRLFAKEPGSHLDLGCADGSLMEIFNSAGFRSQGLEISKDAVALAQAKGLDVHVSDLKSFPKGLANANVVTAFDLLEHVPNPRDVLKAAYNNLQADGYFVFSTLSVKNEDPSDFWFNHSLEHYIYFNHDNLEYALTDIFGKSRFGFIEVEINGIAEFWGFAKKGPLKRENEIISRVESGDFDRKDQDAGYYVSLFYDQLGMFAASRSIIEYFTPRWSANTATLAHFYNYYFQGMFEKAVEQGADAKHMLPAADAVYWQALSDAEEKLFDVKKEDLNREWNVNVLELREQVFKLRDELHGLRNARLLGKIIKARDYVGSARQRIREVRPIPKRVAHQIRVVGAPFVPAATRKFIKREYKRARAAVQRSTYIDKKIVIVENKKWKSHEPLLTVIVPYYNVASTVHETLHSLENQTYQGFRVIVVDDVSTDTTSIEELNTLKKHKLDLQVVRRKKNGGVAAARNTGIEKSHSKYVICLDADDILDPTYIEKCLVVLEASPDTSLVSCHQLMFGVVNELYKKVEYNPLNLLQDNMVITAATYKRSAWEAVGGYKTSLGYEDWEFWLNLAEHGFWGKLIPEALFLYRTSLQSRYVGDKDAHWGTIKRIRSLHPSYKRKIKQLLEDRQHEVEVSSSQTAFINLAGDSAYTQMTAGRPNILITIPWMTFGGAETLIYNYCREIRDKYNLSFVTGLKADHVWEYKFKEITPYVYHLANLFDDVKLYLEFISNYIATRHIDVLHIIHNGFTFWMLEELKIRYPKLKVVVTMFNDRVEYFEQSIGYDRFIDAFITDNNKVAKHYQQKLVPGKRVAVIPNGINCYEEFSPQLFDREAEREKLGIGANDLAVFFVGRLSVEKNPDVFLKSAEKVIRTGPKNVKFFVIGDGPMLPDVERLRQQIGSDRIVYLGYQSAPARFMSAGDIFVLPSAIEGFPLSVLEAMAMKDAIIASDVGAVAEVIESGKAGFVVTPGSVEEISAALIKLAGKPKLLLEMKRFARDKVERLYSNVVLGRNYQDFYKEITKS